MFSFLGPFMEVFVFEVLGSQNGWLNRWTFQQIRNFAIHCSHTTLHNTMTHPQVVDLDIV